ncbi:MAG: penicillin-binding transpeptidase domain-containing protein, partial [Elusimicrobia bacterium]|nr:penicillin-binding transpeptidase domain-containing protein [Elusimicrobiota bacterium]
MGDLKFRFNLCGILCLIPALPIAGRLFYLQTIRHDDLAQKAPREIAGRREQAKPRGRILDRNGVVVAESLITYNCAVLKKDAKNPKALMDVLSSGLGIARQDIEREWDKSGNFFFVKKKILPSEYEKLARRIKDEKITGVDLTAEYSRFYPSGDIAADLLGAVGVDNLGMSGLEMMHEDKLNGAAMRQRSGSLSPKAPKDIYLTIDSKAQFYAESILKKTINRTKALSGFIIVQDPNTGDILAAASYPAQDGQSLPFQWTYEPGSTLKVLTMSAAL